MKKKLIIFVEFLKMEKKKFKMRRGDRGMGNSLHLDFHGAFFHPEKFHKSC